MKFNEEIATAYIKHYGHQSVNARSLNRLITTIFNGRYDTEVSVKRLVYLTCSDETDYEYIQHFAKRYDLVDYDNHVIYEFDGEHHFKFTEFYHNDYAEFVNRRRSDIDKQRILYRLGFDLIRVSGELTIVELFDMLMRSNRQVGQSMFIRNSEMMIVSTGELAFELKDVDMMSQTIVNQMTEINELKRQLDDSQKQIDKLLSNKKIRQYVEQLETNRNQPIRLTDEIEQFLDEEYYKVKHIRYIPLKLLFQKFENWRNVDNQNGESMKFSNFVKQIESKSQNYQFITHISDRKRFKSDKSVISIIEALDIVDQSLINLDKQPYIENIDYIKIEDVQSLIYHTKHPIAEENINDKLVQTIRLAINSENQSHLKSMYSSYL